MSNMTSPEKSPWGWKAVIISVILSCIFLGFFYLAVTNEPDYMPSQKRAEAEKNKVTANTHDTMQMSDEEMQHMQNHTSSTQSAH
ncbi:hypothetical protein [Acinetobacter sp. ANC 4648]|uniref:hypothetical protein n=1 Tax=Acinetobacter sp. ANC 4648 TaxID=1977875 RepID=UPI000A33F49E|nr:hypothetical protein [Acinetobacter sp. ANC 4648]OTG80034.1 hypothetical protein B9T27_13790 [Acinetobacter sp. ANC 4648]